MCAPERAQVPVLLSQGLAASPSLELDLPQTLGHSYTASDISRARHACTVHMTVLERMTLCKGEKGLTPGKVHPSQLLKEQPEISID